MSKTSVATSRPITMTSPQGVTYSLEIITPEIAEQMLTRNTANRRIRKSKVESYGRDMEGGDWPENGQAICFDTDGRLIDGQHRLSAIVATGVSVLMLVVRGLRPEVQDTIDDGAKRTMADTFNFHNVAHANTAAAVARRVLMWENGSRQNAGGTYVPTKAEQLEAWRTDPSLRAAVEATIQMGKKSQLPPSIVGLTWWLFSQLSVEDCQTFWYGLHTGANLTPGSPILILSQKIARTNALPGRVPESQYLAWVIKAWNLWRTGKTVAEGYRGFDLKAGQRFPEPR